MAARKSSAAENRANGTGSGSVGKCFSPSLPLGAERVGVRWGIPERLPRPTSPSHAYGAGPSLSPLKGGEGSRAGLLETPDLGLDLASCRALGGGERGGEGGARPGLAGGCFVGAAGLQHGEVREEGAGNLQ